jgi:hypothetical protein
MHRYFVLRAKIASSYLGISRRIAELVEEKKEVNVLCLGGGVGVKSYGFFLVFFSSRQSWLVIIGNACLPL